VAHPERLPKMKTLVYITGIILSLAGLASLLVGASDLFAALFLCSGLFLAAFGTVGIGGSRKTLAGTLLAPAVLSAYLILSAADASQPMLAFAGLRSAWLGNPLMLAIGICAVLMMVRSKKEANQAPLPTTTAVTPAAEHPPHQP